MKKTLISIILIIFVLTASTYLFLLNLQNKQKAVRDENQEFEYYLNKTIYGKDLATIIDRAIDKNEKNRIEKDEKNHYIENEENSIRIEVKIEETKKTYAMEEIYKNNIQEFMKHFNLAKFTCTMIEYHNKTGKIKKMVFQEI